MRKDALHCKVAMSVLDEMSMEFEVDRDWITSKRRTADHVAVKRLAQWRMKQRGSNYSEIAEIFGVDHTAVKHNIERQQHVFDALKRNEKPQVLRYVV